MNRGFYTILIAQFFSALADNALLFAAIALLKQVHAPSWHTPVLQQAFIISFVILAPFVGAFADSLPKGRVMFISNAIKMVGCIAMLVGINPLLAYGLAGFGAAAYSPAKYGILTEYLPPERLVWANSWMEGLTVSAIILGAVIGGMLITPSIATAILQDLHVPMVVTPAELAIFIIFFMYLVAALFNLYIPLVPIEHKPFSRSPLFLLKDFWHCFTLLWKDPLGQVSLAVTTLFWGAGATLRLLVLSWAAVALHYSMGEAAKLIAWFAVGIAIGAVMAARLVKLEHAVNVLPVGIGMGLLVLVMIPITNPLLAILLLISIGMMAGFFVVPMNALLQHRGHLLIGAGRSIAVQNFNENISIFLMLGLYALMEKLELHLNLIILVFGLLMAGLMGLLYKKHGHDQDNGRI
ncbi:lysophospholipid transporter LplT [Sideroxydans lithotrophicus]|uniref:Major facilitator superfamily MFS_1 n=1 Tax=Sideroxydans lithotrophicus (strain ES-1) TaxID=580332 RepID=D5CUI4_SIDLE|nr:lysophospholipid transporter LplT [Sideroxydans lithotrophicus]ADE12371.1 major facilitator superfamily MFS_1 [Sideroxydans lithotrophicus ES-1]